MGYKIGICGAGAFARQFIRLFKVHSLVDEVVLADLLANRLAESAREHGIARTFPSLEELCRSDVDAICIFTQRWMHGPQVVQALRAGKHVLSAVPAAVTLEELHEVVETVKQTGLLYMLNETSYYRPQTIYCRQQFAKGEIGEFVYGEGQYHHDMRHFYPSFMRSGGDKWRSQASFPPMFYPTHSVSHILSVTYGRMEKVSCFGFVDSHPDGIFNKDLSQWGNVFSNETALFRTSDGGMARINEFRRTGAGESRMTIIGTLGAYEEQTGTATWTSMEPYAGPVEKAGAEWQAAKLEGPYMDVSWIRDCPGVEITEENLGSRSRSMIGKRFKGLSKIHPIERLPDEFAGQSNGHAGSHHFLVVDFLESLKTGKLPPNHVWAAARYTAPGIVAHESAKREGELLCIPDFGVPPKDAAMLDEASRLGDTAAPNSAEKRGTSGEAQCHREMGGRLAVHGPRAHELSNAKS